ncbi:threonine synthase [Candidatus Sumerlaeota bacterium]|nr:threonine synthase [Candidatus Sumerlaeota bacterium]
MLKHPLKLRCVACHAEYDPLEVRYRCDCGDLLDVVHDLDALRTLDLRALWDQRWGSRRFPDDSGVWRYRELILPVEESRIVSRMEGNTRLYPAGKAGDYAGIEHLLLKHEGENPTASFKDRGMTCGITAARLMGATKVACASTGNTSASMASYASVAGMEGIIFIPEGKIAYGKLSQALAYGGKTLQIEGDFDVAMELVQEVCAKLDIYLLNSINPFRIEGQKAIAFELLQQLDWQPPDWIVLPGGNLGNNSAIAKGLAELYDLGIVRKKPRLAVIQAEGANPLYRMWANKTPFEAVREADTIATAIKIGNPVSWQKSLRGLEWSNGVVEQVTEQEIMDAKAWVDASGIGAEPASCCSIAGAKKLREQGVIAAGDRVVGILTGHLLKDPDAVVDYHTDNLGNRHIASTFANRPIQIPATLEAVEKALGA